MLLAGDVEVRVSYSSVNFKDALAITGRGAVAACGLAQGADFPGTVMPFILRGITLYGINCVFTDNATRARAWALLAEHVRGDALERMTAEIGLSDVIAKSTDL